MMNPNCIHASGYKQFPLKISPTLSNLFPNLRSLQRPSLEPKLELLCTRRKKNLQNYYRLETRREMIMDTRYQNILSLEGAKREEFSSLLISLFFLYRNRLHINVFLYYQIPMYRRKLVKPESMQRRCLNNMKLLHVYGF